MSRKIGIQLYTFRREMEADLAGTLTRLAAMGYREAEFCGLFGHSPQSVRALCADLDLATTSNAVDWALFKQDPAACVAQTVDLGADYLSMLWFPEEERAALVAMVRLGAAV